MAVRTRTTWTPIAVLMCGSLAASADEAAVSFLDALQRAPASVRAEVSKLIAEKYPALPDDVTKLIARERPNFFSDIQPDLDKLVAEKYSGIRGYVEAELRTAPQVQIAVDELIAEKYPDLIVEIRALPPGPDLAQRAAALVRNKYPDLLQDVLSVLRERHPKLIVEIQKKVQAKYPSFIADAGGIIITKYPELTGKTLHMMVTKYPDLLPQVFAVLQRAQAQAQRATKQAAPSEAAKE